METGTWGEDIAEDFLVSAGLRILARNVVCGGGELDIVAFDKSRGAAGEIVCVEVKTRASDAYGGGKAAMTSAKRRCVCKAASAYMRKHDLLRRAFRFDLIEVIGRKGGGDPLIRHYRNAFPMKTSSVRRNWRMR